MEHRIYGMSFARLYPLYAEKVERKGRTVEELDDVIEWLTGYDRAEVRAHIEAGSTVREFFDATRITPAASLITGVICGVRVEEIEDPLMQRIRYLDKLVDELARGKALQKVMRAPA